MAIANVPVDSNAESFVSNDGNELSETEISEVISNENAESETEKKSFDAQSFLDSRAGKMVTALGGGLLGGVITNKATDGSVLKTAIGALAGAVVLYKIAPKLPELVEDIKSGNDCYNQQKDSGKTTKWTDRLAYMRDNICSSGQIYAADSDVDMDV